MPANTSPQSPQTTQLLRAYHDSKSPELQARLKTQILELNLTLVQTALQATLHDYQNHIFPSPDFIEVGLQGLSYAIEIYNPQNSQSFITFATPYIHQYVQKYAESIMDEALGAETPSYPTIPAQKCEASPQTTFPNFSSDDTPSGIIKVETMQIFEQYHHNPSPLLRNRLVKINLGLVKKEAHHWSNQCTETYDDLLQVGSMGLLRAIDRFDLDKGYAFSTFAVPYIRGEIQHYLRDKSPTLKVPRQWLTLYNQGCKVIIQLRLQLKREPLDREIAAALGIEVTAWQEVKLACKNRSPLSLDAPVNSEEEEGTVPLGELMQDIKYRSFQLAQEDSMRLHQALSHLEDRTREVVEFVFLKEFTHREVAEILGISAVTVSRQLKKGLTILKQIMTTPID
jgi:RNA polymerase sigma-B factor